MRLKLGHHLLLLVHHLEGDVRGDVGGGGKQDGQEGATSVDVMERLYEITIT